ncbi:hypothetical protein BN2537_15831 [Streptomyces venezuelae]|nr:hypothetical protein BN2537_15831 [Streptomyces venezuelae]
MADRAVRPRRDVRPRVPVPRRVTELGVLMRSSWQDVYPEPTQKRN